MTDPSETIDPITEDIIGPVQIEYEPIPGGQIKLAIKHDGDLLHSSKYKSKVFGSDQLRGQFINNAIDALSEYDVDKSDVTRALREWFSEMNELDKEEQKNKLLTPEVQKIIDGTHYPVEIHGGETTTWNVEMTYAGRSAELEFTAAEMATDSSAALKEKIANQFFELVEIQQDDWQAIRDRWNENSEVVNVVEETAQDAVADRVLSKLSNTIKVVSDREDMGNDVAAAWYDQENTTVYDDAPLDAEIVWIQDDFLVDQLESTGKGLAYKGQLIKDLIARGDLHGSRARKKWAWDTRTKVYPFKPSSLSVTERDADGGGEPNHSEVDA